MKNNKNINKVNKRLVIVFLLLIISIASGTFAWFTFRSNKTTLTLTVGDYDETKVTISPYQINTTLGPSATYYLNEMGNGVFTKIKAVNTNRYSNVDMRLYYKINELDTSLDLSKLKYTIVKSNNEADGSHWIDENINDSSGAAIYTGDFSNVTDGEIIFNEMIPAATSEGNTVVYYRIYLWIDGSNGNSSEYENKILDVELNGELITNGTIPVLDDGMVPVTIADDGTVTTVSVDDPSWYNYNEKKWANIVLVTKYSRSRYKSISGIEVAMEDILAYYVWVPRYRYRVWTNANSSDANKQEIEISFGHNPAVSSYSTTTTIGNWRSHPAFWWDNNSDSSINEGELVSGIWVGKFETSELFEDTPTILPNVDSIDDQTLNSYYQMSKKFISFGNEYGIDSNNTNSHIIKNSEWGAVAYLTNSKYGLNDNLRINNYYNNSEHQTGCGGSATDAATSATCQIMYGHSSDYPQSTTGNISGVFDMSGGAWDYVMGNYNNTIKDSGFTSMPVSKYYDKYTTTAINTSCGGAICYGHAMSETLGWYGDYNKAATADIPWYARGCSYSDTTSAGVYCIKGLNGNSGGNITWRSALTVGVSSDIVVDISTSSTNDFASKQTVTLKWNSDLAVSQYYIGAVNPDITFDITWNDISDELMTDNGYTLVDYVVDLNEYDIYDYNLEPYVCYFALKDENGNSVIMYEQFYVTRVSLVDFSFSDEVSANLFIDDGNAYIITKAGNSINFPNVVPNNDQIFHNWYVNIGDSHYPIESSYTPSTYGQNIGAVVTGNNALFISYYVDGGEIESSTVKSGITYNWSTTTDGLVLLNGDAYQDIYSLGTSGIKIRNNRESEFMNITKWASAAVPTEEWVCYEGCSVANKKFNITDTYSVTDFCSSTSSSCNVKLKVNWKFTGEEIYRHMYRVENDRLAIYYVTTCSNETETCKYTSKYGITDIVPKERYEYVRDNIYGTSTYNNKGVGEIAKKDLTTDYKEAEEHTWYVKGDIGCRQYPESRWEVYDSDAPHKKFNSKCAAVTVYLTGIQRIASSSALEQIYWVPAGGSNPSGTGNISTGQASGGYYGCYVRRSHFYGNSTDCNA